MKGFPISLLEACKDCFREHENASVLEGRKFWFQRSRWKQFAKWLHGVLRGLYREHGGYIEKFLRTLFHLLL